mgnify:CR=1 FL=1|eukprot:scaffold48170_cov36-Tisochrysis_lutea.AAC.1
MCPPQLRARAVGHRIAARSRGGVASRRPLAGVWGAQEGLGANGAALQWKNLVSCSHTVIDHRFCPGRCRQRASWSLQCGAPRPDSTSREADPPLTLYVLKVECIDYARRGLARTEFISVGWHVRGGQRGSATRESTCVDVHGDT